MSYLLHYGWLNKMIELFNGRSGTSYFFLWRGLNLSVLQNLEEEGKVGVIRLSSSMLAFF